MPTPHHWINGKIVPATSASIGITDLGLLRGFGIFDYFLFVNGKTIFMEEHIDRFFRSADTLGMKMGISKTVMTNAIGELIAKNGRDIGGIRLVLTGGYAQDGYSFSGESNLLILQHDFSLPAPELFERGFHLMTHEYQRDLPEVKTTNYLLPITLKPKLEAVGADDVLYVYNDRVSETSRANFFIIDRQGTLITSTGNVLEGITRNKTLEIAKDKMNVELRPFTIKEMWDAKEVFITSTTKGVLAVTKIDNKVVGNGQPGEKTLFLAALLNKLVAEHQMAQSY